MTWDHVAPIAQLSLPGEPVKKLILLFYANHANVHNEVFAFRQTIADECGVSLTTLKKYISEFRDNGVLIEVDDGRGRRRSTLYLLDVDRARGVYGVLTTTTRLSEADRREIERKRQNINTSEKTGKQLDRFSGDSETVKRSSREPKTVKQTTENGQAACPPIEPKEKKETGAGAREPDEGSNAPEPTADPATPSPAPTAPCSAKAVQAASPPPDLPKIGDRWHKVILPLLRGRHGAEKVNLWLIKGVAVVADTGGLLILHCDSAFKADRITTDFKRYIARASSPTPGPESVIITAEPWADALGAYAEQVAASRERLGLPAEGGQP